MVVCDAVLRKLPGALGHEESAVEESFSEALEGAPEYPHYTRPYDWHGHTVPEILLSGDHARVREWRLEQSRARSRRLTPYRLGSGAGGPKAGAPRRARRPRESRARAFAAIGVRRVAAYHSGSRDRRSAGRASSMSGVIDSIERAQLRRVPVFQAGDRVRVHFQVVEGTRRRTQVFEGVVIKRQGSGARETFTVRKQSFGVGVERTFPLHSPKIEKIEVAARGDVRRAKLYYLRDRVGRGARVRERRWTGADRGPGLRRGRDAAGRRAAPGRGGAGRGDGAGRASEARGAPPRARPPPAKPRRREAAATRPRQDAAPARDAAAEEPAAEEPPAAEAARRQSRRPPPRDAGADGRAGTDEPDEQPSN